MGRERGGGGIMTKATSVLRHEHEAILKMLDVADEVSRRVERGIAIAPDVFTGLVEFFRLFADKCHHGKEEDLLFPAMEGKGVPRHGGPVGVMLIEHEQGRARVKEMAAVSEEIANGNTAAAVRWVPAARGYSDLLRAHIQKENNVLFVMAERILSDDEQAELSRGFEKVEIDKMGPGTHERLHALMDRLVAEILA
jgi:hemerythrin-like domain-containing protein